MASKLVVSSDLLVSRWPAYYKQNEREKHFNVLPRMWISSKFGVYILVAALHLLRTGLVGKSN